MSSQQQQQQHKQANSNSSNTRDTESSKKTDANASYKQVVAANLNNKEESKKANTRSSQSSKLGSSELSSNTLSDQVVTKEDDLALNLNNLSLQVDKLVSHSSQSTTVKSTNGDEILHFPMNFLLIFEIKLP